MLRGEPEIPDSLVFGTDIIEPLGLDKGTCPCTFLGAVAIMIDLAEAGHLEAEFDEVPVQHHGLCKSFGGGDVVAIDPGAVGTHSREETGAGRAADGVLIIGPGEESALLGQRVKVR